MNGIESLDMLFARIVSLPGVIDGAATLVETMSDAEKLAKIACDPFVAHRITALPKVITRLICKWHLTHIGNTGYYVIHRHVSQYGAGQAARG